MYTMLTNRRDDKDRDEGFTLIELMVVVLIIAILLAIAIPTFLGAQTSAKDRGAQSTARNALTSAKTVFADTGDYSDVTIDLLQSVEPGIEFGVGASDDPKVVSVMADALAGADVKVWYAAVQSESGTCYYIRDSVDTASAGVTPGTMYAKNEAASCTATATPTGVLYAADGWDNDTAGNPAAA